MHQTARTYLSNGLSVLPANKQQKRPTVNSWKQYQDRLPTECEIDAWFANPQSGICVITGKVSGNLEIIDFDNGGELFGAWAEQIPPGLFEKLVIEQSPSGGYHAIYRCVSEICGNVKLAQRQNEYGKAQTLIETRGEGGLFLCAPTDGYKLIHGDFDGIQTISSHDREQLLQTAWGLNEHIPEPVNYVQPNNGIF